MRVRILLVAGLGLFSWYSHATFSIIGCDNTGQCGVAVATHNLAVGATVPFAKAKVGAVVSQFETNPGYGPAGLDLLSGGMAPALVVQELLRTDGHFEGLSTEYRQVAVVNSQGQTASYTGSAAAASGWAGALQETGVAVQGNGLVSALVLQAMLDTYRRTEGPLATRLMAGLLAGEAAGGQSIGLMSAALLVRTPEGHGQDLDFRVDDSAVPVTDLQLLVNKHYAHQAMLQAERLVTRGKPELARQKVTEALHSAGNWDRIWRRAARLAVHTGDTWRAMDYLAVFVALNPVWARHELADPLYKPLHSNPLFERWQKSLVQKATVSKVR